MPAPAPPRPNRNWEGLFSGALGLWLGLAFLKFGHPIILDQKISAPANRDELLYQAWPVAWGYGLLLIVFLLATRVGRWPAGVPRWVLALPLGWLGWQALAATRTIDASLTSATLKHFAACVVAFYLGLFALSRVERRAGFWLGLLGGFLVVLAIGWEQHGGGLERTRKFFYEQSDWQQYPPEFLKKIASDRIFSTLVYPNALAGAILLVLPILLAGGWRWTVGRAIGLRLGMLAAIGALAGGCLYWSGSKAGWLIALGQGTVAFLRSGLPRRLKIGAAVLLALAGLAGFSARHAGYFQRGATSATARLDYWEAAWHTMVARPWLGAGPGTFMVSYRSIKRPESEMTRLAHNDYLQQGADSGVIGLLAYTGFWVGSLVLLYRRSRGDIQLQAIWLGLAGLASQSCVEFGLYIPALAWPLFVLLGLAWGSQAETEPPVRAGGVVRV